MVVRKTKKGRFTFALSYELRDKIFRALIAFLEDETPRARLSRLVQRDEVMLQLYYSTLNDILTTRDFCHATTEEIKWTLSRTHAIALMWLLRQHDDDLPMLELKSQLHQTLQP